MALIHCPECKKIISSAAISCPHCGIPLVCPECGHKHPPLEARIAAKGVSTSRRRTIVLLLAISLAVIGVAWNAFRQESASVSAALSPPAMSRQVILRLAGSDPGAARLLTALAEAYLQERGAHDVHRIAGGSFDPVRVEGTFPAERAIKTIEIAWPNPGRSMENLAEGWAEIGLSPRRPMLDASAVDENILAADGMAIIVHPDNPIGALSRNHVAALLGGLITDWRQLKQSYGQIRLYVPAEGGGDHEALRRYFPGLKAVAAHAQRFTDPVQVSGEVANDPGAAAIVPMSLTGRAKVLAIEDPGVRGSFPSAADIAGGAYPLARRYYLYHAKSGGSPAVRDFIDMSLSAAGRNLVRDAGFVSLENAPEMAAASTGDSEYAGLTANALHLSFDIHFSPASARLDAAALRQIKRTEAFLHDLGPDDYALVLLGFSDPSGNPAHHLRVSRLRAQQVEQAFKRRIKTRFVVAGLGSYQPGGAESSTEGDNGRRVEVWLKQR